MDPNANVKTRYVCEICGEVKDWDGQMSLIHICGGTFKPVIFRKCTLCDQWIPRLQYEDHWYLVHHK